MLTRSLRKIVLGGVWLPAIGLIFIAAVTAYAVGQISEPTVATIGGILSWAVTVRAVILLRALWLLY